MEITENNLEIIPNETEAIKKIDISRNKGWWDKDPEKLVKLELAFAQGNNDEDTCAYAEISLDQLYYYCREIDPTFQVRKEQLKAKPVLAAMQTLTKAVMGYREKDENGIERIIPPDLDTTKWYLERKRKKDFSLRTEVTGADGKDLYELPKEQKEKLDRFINGQPINDRILESEPTPALEPGPPADGSGDDSGTPLPQ